MNDFGVEVEGEGHLPVVGQLTVGLDHGIGLPYWFTELHMLFIVMDVLEAILGRFLLRIRLGLQYSEPPAAVLGEET